MSLPTPPEWVFKEYRKLITEFIWNKKRPKIRYNKPVQGYEGGGLKLIDLEAKNYALKAAWIPKWKYLQKNDNDNLEWLYLNLPIKEEKIWKLGLSEKDIKQLFPTTFDMGHQIWIAWAKIMVRPKFDSYMYNYCPIWYNSQIRISNKPICNTKLLESPLQNTSQIYDKENACFLTYSQLAERYGILPFNYLVYFGICKAVAKLLKRKNENLDCDPNESDPTNTILASKLTHSKNLYCRYLQVFKKVDNSSSTLRWETELNLTISEDMWLNLYYETMFIANSTKLRYFQYKITNKILTTNVT